MDIKKCCDDYNTDRHFTADSRNKRSESHPVGRLLRSMIDIRGIAGRRKSGKQESLTNAYQGKLLDTYDKWSKEFLKWMKGINPVHAGSVQEAAVFEGIDNWLETLADRLEEVNQQGMIDAYRYGAGKSPDVEGLATIAESMKGFREAIRDRYVPRIRANIKAQIAKEQNPAMFVLADMSGLVGLLLSERPGLGGGGGGYWAMMFKGAGRKTKDSDKKRQQEGKKKRRVKWVLDFAAEHCSPSAGFYGCPELAGIYESWDDLPTVPGGQVTCRFNCRCRLEVETDSGWYGAASARI